MANQKIRIKLKAYEHTLIDQSAARSYEQFLSRRISMDFSETPFSEVLEYLREVGAMNVMVDPQVNRDEGVGEYKVSLKLKDIEIRTALMLLAGMWDLGYGLRGLTIHAQRNFEPVHKSGARDKAHGIRHKGERLCLALVIPPTPLANAPTSRVLAVAARRPNACRVL